MSVSGLKTEVEDGELFQSEKALWENFAGADTDKGFFDAWLNLQCHLLQQVETAALLLGNPDEGPYLPVSVWPDPHRNIQGLSRAAEKALAERRGLVVDLQDGSEVSGHQIGLPIEIDDKIHGLVVAEIPSSSNAELQTAMRQMYWGSAWLSARLLQQNYQPLTPDQIQYGQVLDLLSHSLEQRGFFASALTLATELSTQLMCERVSIGFLRKNHIKVVAVSHSAEFGAKANLINLIGNAMDECFDQYSTVHFGETSKRSEYLIRRAHQKLAEKSEVAEVLTVPLVSLGEIVGAITFEGKSSQFFADGKIALCEAVAAMAAPILEEKRQNDRSVAKKASDFIGHQLGKVLGPGHVGLKVALLLLAAVVAFFSIATGEYRVSAKTVIEGEVRRAVTAPFSGYIAEAKSRHGDVVGKDQVLAVLDDRDISLQRLKAAGQKQQLLRQYREAIAGHDKAEVRIINAQLGQVDTDLKLYDYQLARTRLAAPFQGVIVSGDLSQSLDAPVEKGQVLFEIAPLDAYRVILQVDEREIDDVVVGQPGTLALSGLPDDRLEFVVKNITPVALASEGRNYFRVEAQLDSSSQRLRPGMEGVGKIRVDQRKLIWVWTHKLVDWFRLWVWSWWP